MKQDKKSQKKSIQKPGAFPRYNSVIRNTSLRGITVYYPNEFRQKRKEQV